ncbi:hypothetical protein TNCV_150161 [Trichonephila clavipes]|nr:hypothetical protein TNCV_150161 [Trichonephila clavipes]
MELLNVMNALIGSFTSNVTRTGVFHTTRPLQVRTEKDDEFEIGFMKSLLYEKPVPSVEDLITRMSVVFGRMQDMPGIVLLWFCRRVRSCDYRKCIQFKECFYNRECVYVDLVMNLLLLKNFVEL